MPFRAILGCFSFRKRGKGGALSRNVAMWQRVGILSSDELRGILALYDPQGRSRRDGIDGG